MKEEAVYKIRDIANLTGLTKRTVALYTDIGLVVPDVKGSSGKGFLRLYSSRNLREFYIIIELKEVGVELATIKKYLHKYRDDFDALEQAVRKIKDCIYNVEFAQF